MTPDPSLAVGEHMAVHTVNSDLVVIDKGGSHQRVWETTLDPISSAGGPCPPQQGIFGGLGATRIVDPKVLYNHHPGEKGFLVVGLQREPTPVPSPVHGVYFGYALGEQPQVASWTTVRTPGEAVVGGASCRLDFSGLGMNDTRFVYTGIYEPFAGGPPAGALVRWITISDVVSGNPTPFYEDYFYAIPTTSHLPQPAHSYDPTGLVYLIGVGNPGQPSGTLTVTAINPVNPGSPQVFVANVPVPSFALPASGVPQKNTTDLLDGLDGRIQNVVLRNGSLWTCHAVLVAGKTVARWYEIRLGGFPYAAGSAPTLAQSGEIDLPANSGGATVHTFFPAITVNAFDDAAIVFARSAANEYPSVEGAWRSRCMTPGTMQTPVQLAPGTSPFTNSALVGNNVRRWGDYFSIAPDPSDATRFWCAGEVAVPGVNLTACCDTSADTNYWQTKIAVIGTGVGNHAIGSSSNYGQGWLGTHFVPTIRLLSAPRIGTEFRIEVGNSTGMIGAPYVLLFGLAPASIAWPPGSDPLTSPTLLVDPSIMIGLEYVFGQPFVDVATVPAAACDPALIGINLYFQAVVPDAGAVGGLALTDGLHVILGY